MGSPDIPSIDCKGTGLSLNVKINCRSFYLYPQSMSITRETLLAGRGEFIKDNKKMVEKVNKYFVSSLKIVTNTSPKEPRVPCT